MMTFRSGRRLATVATFFLLVISTAPAAAASPSLAEEGRDFITALADRAIESLTTDGISRPQRIERFRALFREHFASREIAVWVLARHWRRASPEQRDEYLALFEDYIVAAYVDRFAEYTGEALHVDGTFIDGQMIVVHSEIVRPGGEASPIRIDWSLEAIDDTLKVVDLVVEGVSMRTTLRSDFGSIIRREGGQVAGLLDLLRNKAESLAP